MCPFLVYVPHPFLIYTLSSSARVCICLPARIDIISVRRQMNATRLFYGNLIRFTVYPNSWLWIQHDLQLSSMIKVYQNWKWQITTILKALHNFVHEHFLLSLLLYWCFQLHSVFCQVQTSTTDPDKKWLHGTSYCECTLFLLSFARREYDSCKDK